MIIVLTVANTTITAVIININALILLIIFFFFGLVSLPFMRYSGNFPSVEVVYIYPALLEGNTFRFYFSTNLHQISSCLMHMKQLRHGWSQKTWIRGRWFLQWCVIQVNRMQSKAVPEFAYMFMHFEVPLFFPQNNRFIGYYIIFLWSWFWWMMHRILDITY